MALRSLDHVTVNCADLDRSRAFYSQALGLTDGKRPNFAFPGAWLYVGDRPVVHLVGGRDGPPRRDAADRPWPRGDAHAAVRLDAPLGPTLTRLAEQLGAAVSPGG